MTLMFRHQQRLKITLAITRDIDLQLAVDPGDVAEVFANGAVLRVLEILFDGNDVSIVSTDTGVKTVLIDNESTGASATARLAITGDDAGVALYAAGTNKSAAIITGGPTGQQSVLRNLGSYPMSFGTANKERMRLLGTGELRLYDNGNTDFAEFHHDGTDFNTTFTTI